MRKRFIIAGVVLLVVFGGLFAFDMVRNHFINQFFAHMKMPPATVSTAPVRLYTYQPLLHATGGLAAANGTMLSTQTSGEIAKISFKSGDFVKKGTLLLSLDSVIAKQTLLRDLSKLKLATINYKRALRLYKRKAYSLAQLDETQASLAQSMAVVKIDEHNLVLKHVRAPFSGQLGIRKVNVGQYVALGTPVVSLQADSPLYANFTLPEQDLPDVHLGQKLYLTVDSHPGMKFWGKVTALNATVNPETRNIAVQATVQNKKKLLYPGTYTNVDLLLPLQKNVMMIPATAISYSLYGDTAYIVKKLAGKEVFPVKQTVLQLGQAEAGKVIVKSGLKPGDIVVTAGQLKLHYGSTVNINNTVKLN